MAPWNRIHLAVLLVLLWNARASIFPVHPSYGDVVINEYLDQPFLMIYLGPDGIEFDSRLYHVCADGNSAHGAINKVISRELGYEDTGCSTTGCSTWNRSIPGIVCPPCAGTENHLLRCCGVEAVYNLTTQCDSVLIIYKHCHSKQALYNYDGHKGYNGEVLLFPPVSEADKGKATPSMGMVAVKKEGDCQDWRFITKDAAVDQSLANTVCRQMGFTGVNPGFVMTREEFEQLYPAYNFNTWEHLMKDPGLPASEIECGKSRSCLACCDYHNLKHCTDSKSPQLEVDKILVIRCTFYLDGNVVESGNENICKFTNGEHSTVCWKDVDLETSKFIAAVAVPSGVLLVICIILSVITVLLCLKCQCRNRCRHGDYQRVDGEDQPQPNAQN